MKRILKYGNAFNNVWCVDKQFDKSIFSLTYNGRAAEEIRFLRSLQKFTKFPPRIGEILEIYIRQDHFQICIRQCHFQNLYSQGHFQNLQIFSHRMEEYQQSIYAKFLSNLRKILHFNGTNHQKRNFKTIPSLIWYKNEICRKSGNPPFQWNKS